MKRKLISVLAALAMTTSLTLPALADTVDVAIVDVTAPTNTVTIQSGVTNIPIKINATVSGRQSGTATFKVYKTWTLKENVFTGSDPETITVATSSISTNTDVTQTYTINGIINVDSNQAEGDYPLVVSAFDITNTGTKAKLDDGSDSNYQVVVTNPDITAPTFTSVPAGFSKEATGVNTPVSAEELGTATATDESSCTVTNDAPAVFPYGNTTVTWTATDAYGNKAYATQVVTIIDNTKPEFKFVPANFSKEATAVNTPITEAELGTATATDIFDVTVTNNAPAVFPYGDTTVTWTATDAHGLTSTATQIVTITDTTPPVFNVSPTAKKVEATAKNTPKSDINFGDVVATDIFEPVTVTNDAPETFPLGDTTVTWTATDAHGLKSTVNQVITIVDTTAPVIEQHADITAEATSSEGAVVNFTPTANDTVDGDVAVICSPASGSTFPLGETTVHCTATDKHGNTATSDFKVTVQDTTAPVLTLPENITVFATKAAGADVTFTATANDAVDGTVPVIYTTASGSTFGLGITTVNCTAKDKHGNTATGSFTVTVKYNFNGFFQPVDTGVNVFNTVKAGSAIPVKFSLNGDMGLDIFATGYPKLVDTTVSPDANFDEIESVVAATNSGLSYDSVTKTYTYVWKTDKSWTGAGKQLVIKLKDGTICTAKFLFK